MPSGKNHDRITWLSLPVVVSASILVTHDSLLTLIVAVAFIFSGFMFGPDLDIYSLQYQRWGRLKFMWLPYQKSLKHRSILSHGFLIGSLIRVVYLLLMLLLVAMICVAIAQLIWGFTWNWQKFLLKVFQAIKTNYLTEVISFGVGLELGAMSHYLADQVDSWLKSRQKKAKNRKKSRKKPK